jgi:hypothetical protein
MPMARVIGLVIVVAVSTGCLARGGLVGEREANLDSPVMDLHGYVLVAFRTHRITIEEERASATRALIKGRYADGEPITIQIDRLTPRASAVTVQVGAFGDEVRSRVIMDDLRRRSAAARGSDRS